MKKLVLNAVDADAKLNELFLREVSYATLLAAFVNVFLISSPYLMSADVSIYLYLYKSTIRPYMEYCCHVWAGAPSCYLELLDKI